MKFPCGMNWRWSIVTRGVSFRLGRIRKSDGWAPALHPTFKELSVGEWIRQPSSGAAQLTACLSSKLAGLIPLARDLTNVLKCTTRKRYLEISKLHPPSSLFFSFSQRSMTVSYFTSRFFLDLATDRKLHTFLKGYPRHFWYRPPTQFQTGIDWPEDIDQVE